MTPQTATAPRSYDLDWLRVLAFCILVPFHTGMMFNTWGFHIKNVETTSLLDHIMIFQGQWRLSLLFLISGAGVFFALRKRTVGEFRRERWKRLGIPLLFGMAFIIPPQIWVERSMKGHTTLDYVQWWLRDAFTQGTYSEGSTAGNISWHHLWFIVYILVYSMLFIGLLAKLRTQSAQDKINRAVDWLSKPFLFLLPAIVFGLFEQLKTYFPVTHNLTWDWYNHAVSILMFSCGFVIASSERVRNLFQRQRWTALSVGLVCTVICYIFYWLPEDNFTPLQLIPYRFLKALNYWAWICAFLGMARHYLQFTNSFLSYANEMVMPFYILHQTITLVLGYFILPLQMGLWVKFALSTFGTYVIALALVEVIRRVAFLRPLFGLKSLGKARDKDFVNPLPTSASEQISALG
ncbi:MAG: acyltransferase family protein [Ignavibacteria bacterium]|nr:acyltransferase family protein [Ignavibacteria bacterium]